MAKVTNWKVYDLEESIYASGYPHTAEMPTEKERAVALDILENDVEKGIFDQNKHIKRAISLAKQSGGHDNFLKGIIVNFDLTFSNKAWVEMERYQFCQIVSSQSTMHKISQMDISECCNRRYVTCETMVEMERLQEEYHKAKGTEDEKEAYLELLYNMPSGLELTARMTTNYMCLKNIYKQRRHHRLPDWHVFCDWVESLPMAKELIFGGLCLF